MIRNNKIPIPDGIYSIEVKFNGYSKRFYNLHVMVGVPNLIFPLDAVSPNGSFRSILLDSKTIKIDRDKRDNVKLSIAQELPNPNVISSEISVPGVDIGKLFVALNSENLEQAVMKKGRHFLFSTKGRKAWSEPLNLLLDYFYLVIDREWMDQQCEDDHPLRYIMMEVNKKIDDAVALKTGDIANISLDDPIVRWFLDFSFHLFIVSVNEKLEERTLARLKISEMFLSTVHELFVASSFIRNGFEIQLEDEEDRSKRHTEFIAIHRASNDKFSIEAKLAGQNIFKESKNFRMWPEPKGFRYKNLLNDAVAKRPEFPLVVVIDLNRPPIVKDYDKSKFNEYLYSDLIRNISPDNGVPDNWIRIELVNKPYLFSESKKNPMGFSRFAVHSNNSIYPPSSVESLRALDLVFSNLDVSEEIGSLAVLLKDMLSKTGNRFSRIGSREVIFNPSPE